MDPIIALSVLFLLSPVLGYIVIALPWSIQTKIRVAIGAAFLLAVTPIAVMLVTG